MMLFAKNLNTASSICVHFVLENEISSEIYGQGISVFEASLEAVKTEKDLFQVVAEAMLFPDYFGNNWDALNDCLRDLSWCSSPGFTLLLRDAKQAWVEDPYLMGTFVNAWLFSNEYWFEVESKPFHLIFVVD